MTQMLLFPDPRPLVERLGADFFRQAPQSPGVYLMRDAGDTVLYVGKAKNLRKRLASYRVANPDRMRPRHLRLLRAVAGIDLQECPDEVSALVRESELIRNLRPRFNRAGTWPGPTRFLSWRITGEGLDLAVSAAVAPGWNAQGPLGASAIYLRATLVRLLWCAIHPARGLAGMPEGWFRGRFNEVTTIPSREAATDLHESESCLSALFNGSAEDFSNWIRKRTALQSHPFESAVRDADLEEIIKFPHRQRLRTSSA
jgi:hypothetical protein